MKRDVRLGAEHWTGCHNFENIICDGDVEKASGPRQGGLKMGGKYWYYVGVVHAVSENLWLTARTVPVGPRCRIPQSDRTVNDLLSNASWTSCQCLECAHPSQQRPK